MLTAPDQAPMPSLLRHRSFMMFWCARTSTTGAYQMLSVAIGWQLYDLTNNPLDLGIVGLVQLVPLLSLSLFVGQISDRSDRRVVIAVAQIVKAAAAIALALGSLGGWLTRELMFGLVFVIGVARSFEVPTIHAILPDIVPKPMLPRAIAASVSAQQTAIIAGPAIGGLLYALGPQVVYSVCLGVFLTTAVLISLVKTALAKQDRSPVTLSSMFAGFSYIRSRQVLFGVISLDLFAVLCGQVTALLPIFARDVLGTGPWGLGLLRSAPAIGALTMSVVLSRYTITRRAGVWLFASVAAYGLAIGAFGFSNTLVLSMIALATYGAVDAVSVVIRHSLVISRTPNEMMGRVTAVNTMFTGASGMIGDFRAGAVAAAFGVVPAVLIGALSSVAVTVLWMRLFPELTRIDKLTGDT
jgi:MFS family permease